MRSKPLILALGVLAALAVFAPAARADGGRVPIYQPTTITQPGHYVVTRDITGTGVVIRIEASNVSLDLNGFTITSSLGALDRAIDIEPVADGGDIEVRNGRLQGGFIGLRYHLGLLQPKQQLRLERLDVSAAGGFGITVYGAPTVEIVGCSVHDLLPSQGTAIVVEVGDAPGITGVIADNRVSNVPGFGLTVVGMNAGAIRNNSVTGFGAQYNGAAGLSIIDYAISPNAPGGLSVQGNRVRKGGTNSTGMLISATMHRCHITDNVVTTVHTGISVASNGNRLASNVVGDTGTIGVALSGSDNTLERNHVESGAGNGVVVSGANNLLDVNSIQGHSVVGIKFVGPSTNNAYRGNMLRNNVAGATVGVASDLGGNVP